MNFIRDSNKDAGDATDSQESVEENKTSPVDTTLDSVDDELEKGAASKRCNRWLPLGIGLAVLASIGTGVFFLLDNNKVALSKSEVQNQDFQGTVSKAELFAHSDPDDCWMLIGDKVYDLTEYAPNHPGGADLVTDLCGTDGTKEYEMTHPLSLMRTIPETLLGSIEEGYVPPVVDEDEEEEDGEEEEEDGEEDGFVYVPPTVDETEKPEETDPAAVTGSPNAPPANVFAPTTAAASDPPVAEDMESEAPVSEAPAAPSAPISDAPAAPAAPAAAPAAAPSSSGSEAPVVAIPPLDFSPTTAFISEIHYDNIGGDVNQMIEVAFSNQLDVSGYTVEFYRGSTGLVYDVQSLQAFAIGNSVNGLTFASRIVDSFQNGPDGLALVDGNGGVVEFISYGGVIQPDEGVAAGMLSTDIGVVQSGSDPIGYTLQKTGTGCSGDDFAWGTIAEGTPGDVNVDMQVACYPEGAPVPAPAPWAETLSPTAACYAQHYSWDTIALHDSTEDCWEAIFGIVYDFTVYAYEHSGGADDIHPHCGTDTTEAYLDRHSRGLLKYVTQYIIGRVTESEEGNLVVPCERRLERADSGYWDYEWETVKEFEEFDWESVQEEEGEQN